MQDKNKSIEGNDEHASPSLQRTERLLDFLEKQLERPHEPADKDFRNIIAPLVTESELYKTIGLTTVADHFVSGMRLHLLSLVAIFKGKAEQEGIPQREYQTTLNDVLPKTFLVLEKLRKQLTIHSLDELVALYNITIKLYTFSSIETAEDAQKWLYELPETYIRRLKQAGMLFEEEDTENRVTSASTVPSTPFVSWQTVYVSSNKLSDGNIIVSTAEEALAKPVTVEIETRDPSIGSAA